jgi:hypothetical protein
MISSGSTVHMKRTTIMADEELLERLRRIARSEGRPFAEIVREGLELRAAMPAPKLHFIGVGESRPGSGPTARQSADLTPEPRPWR